MEFKVKPWEHQREVYERAKDLPGFGLFFDPRTGKSMTAITLARYKMNTHRRILRTLIFCPPIVVPNWKDEWKKYSDIPMSKVTCLQGPGKERVETVRKYGFHVDDTREPAPRIFITNYESLLMKPLLTLFHEWKPELIIFDESHNLKSFDSQRSKKADGLANPPWAIKPYKYILSGSPVLNAPWDLFMQYKILDGGKTFGENFYVFRNRYFHDANAAWKNSATRKYFPDWQVRPGAVEEINNLIQTTSKRVLKSECFDLPPFDRQIVKCQMTPEQTRVYKELSRAYISFVGERVISSTLAITKALRLQQIASGFCSLDGTGDEEDKATHRFEENPKLEMLEHFLQEITESGHKVIVWAVWVENYGAIRKVCEKLKLKYVEIHGQVNEKKKMAAKDEFNNNPEIKVVIAHPGSGGEGITLMTPYAIFYSRTFSLKHSIQAEARNYGPEAMAHEKVTRIDLVCEGTIEEEIVEALYRKEKMAADVLSEKIALHL